MPINVIFLMPPTVSGSRNGVVSQALNWKRGLDQLGVNVDLANPWEEFNWSSYNIIHAFGTGNYLEILPKLKKKGIQKIVLSPIIDSERKNATLKILSKLRIESVNMTTEWATLKKSLSVVDCVLVRSNYEKSKVRNVFGISSGKIATLKLPQRFVRPPCPGLERRNDCCLHVSILSSVNKNVPRLIEASIKYNFNLRLAGNITDKAFERYFFPLVERHDNISYLGVLSDAKLQKEYQTCRVFALPSLMEGVGLVALEAAAHGADIVITNRGGPKEYYGKYANLVDPTSIDSIGENITEFMNGASFQPALSTRVNQEFTPQLSAENLLEIYNA